MKRSDKFNSTNLSKWLNSKSGRIFRFFAGLFFLVIGIMFNHKILGIAALAWFIFPLTAGALDICYISAALGGPLKGKEIRDYQTKRT